MVELVTRKRIEILGDAPLAPLLVRMTADAGIAGYSLLPVQSGAGRGGAWRDDQLTGATGKVILLTIASDEKAARLVEALAPLLESHGLLLTLGDVQVVRGERF